MKTLVHMVCHGEADRVEDTINAVRTTADNEVEIVLTIVTDDKDSVYDKLVSKVTYRIVTGQEYTSDVECLVNSCNSIGTIDADYMAIMHPNIRLENGWDTTMANQIGDSKKVVSSALTTSKGKYRKMIKAIKPGLEFTEVKTDLDSGVLLSFDLLFAETEWFIETPLDPDMYFHLAEVSLSLRSWTQGYDVVLTDVAYLDRPREVKGWQQHLNRMRLETESKRFLVLALNDSRILGRFGAGTVRSGADFANAAGFSLTYKLCHPHNTSPTQEIPVATHSGWVTDKQLMEQTPGNWRVEIFWEDIPLDNVQYIAMGLVDTKGNNIHRVDIKPGTSEENNDILQGVCNTISFITNNTTKPDKYFIWPKRDEWDPNPIVGEIDVCERL